jgi:D-xylose transport system permease protein
VTATATTEPTAAREVPEPRTLREVATNYVVRLRGGELGSVPIVVGLLLLTVIFAVLNPAFLTPRNFVNLIVQMAPLALIAVGVVFVLLIAEVDLSVGYLAGMGSVILARLLTENGWPVIPAIALVLLTGVTAGMLQGTLVAKLGLPSLIVTLAALVGFNGMVLILIGGRGTVTISDPVIVGFANTFLSAPVAYGLMALFVALFAATQLRRRAAREVAQLPLDPIAVPALRVLGVALLAFGAVFYASLGRGFPLIGMVLLAVVALFTIVQQRTTFGRHVMAVGGNPEAARRAGINVDRIRISCFMISGGMAAMGALALASRLRSVDTNAGGGQIELNAIAAAVIGGTSLFGGRGTVVAALFGALVIQGVDNGMGLLGLSSGVKFTVTAAVLLVAVLVDSVARKGRAAHGR